MQLDLGDYQVRFLTDGNFGLDGGAMFGIVPRVLWETIHPPDTKNRIRLGLVCLLVEGHGHRILIEAGIGTTFPPKQQAIYAIDQPQDLRAQLAQCGLEPGDIDWVLLTHLHFDHAGGLTYVNEGVLQPTFPHARHIVQDTEFRFAQQPNERARPSYRQKNLAPVIAADLFETVDGRAEVLPGIRVAPTPGHTAGHQSIFIEGGDRTLVFVGDLIPTSGHTHVPYVMAYDLEPATTFDQKRLFLAEAEAQNWLLVWPHEPQPAYGRVAAAKNRFEVVDYQTS